MPLVEVRKYGVWLLAKNVSYYELAVLLGIWMKFERVNCFSCSLALVACMNAHNLSLTFPFYHDIGRSVHSQGIGGSRCKQSSRKRKSG